MSNQENQNTNHEMIREFLEAAYELQQAIVKYQTKTDALVDFGARVRGMTECLAPSKGLLDDPFIMKLPKGIIPRTAPQNEGGEGKEEEQQRKRRVA